MIDRILDLVAGMGDWKYVVIFLAVAMESAAFLGFVVPGEAMAIFAGFLASRGLVPLGFILALVCVAAVGGDSLGYQWGRWLGREWLLRYGRWVGIRQRHLERVDRFFDRHGGQAVFIGRFTAFLRALVPFVAGSSRMRYGHFLLYNVIGGVTWGVGAVMVGYVAGASWQLVERWIGGASALVLGLLAVVGALVWLWHWVSRHEDELKAWWGRVAAHRSVEAVRRRLRPVIAFLQARMTPGGYFGLYLSLGALVMVAAAWLFGVIAHNVLAGRTLAVMDLRVATWLHHHASPPFTAAMRAVTELGAAPVISGLGLLAATVYVVRREWRRLATLFLVLPGGVLLNEILKFAFHRPRPHFAHPLVVLTSYSFPSGHTAAAMLFYGLMAVVVARTARTWRRRVLAVLGALLLIGLVAFSRLYLGAHFLSDVLGAMAEGLAWLSLCLTGIETFRRAREGSRD